MDRNDDLMKTGRAMACGLALAVLMVAPFAVVMLNHDWPWSDSVPVRLLNVMLSMMIVLFHELGHAVAGWFYGYVTLPGFDVIHGGGMTYQMTGQLFVLNLVWYGVLAYLYRHWEGYPLEQRILVAIGVFHVATAYVPAHNVVFYMAGPLAEAGVAGFMLARAWLNQAPRGVIERVLNAAFGFGMALHIGCEGWALLHDDSVREVFHAQKGGHGLGDFDQIAALSGVSFDSVVSLWLLCAIVCAGILPVILYGRQLND